MKTRSYVSVLVVVVTLITGCVVAPTGRVGLVAPIVVYEQPAVVISSAPVAVVQTTTVVPEAYIQTDIGWIGWYGDTYVYLGPGNVWVVCDEFRLRQFHRWESYHHGYRERAIRYHREDNRGRDNGHNERKDNRSDKRDRDQH